jgi:hypothetical protein
MEFELIKKSLQDSGSFAARDKKSPYFETSVNDAKGGFVYAPSKKRVYNTDELKKAIDVTVFELIPEGQETELDLVPRPVYNDVTRSLELANETIASQSVEIGNLESQVSELTSISASLDIQLDNERLLRVTAESNSEQLRKQFALVNDTLQTSLQRSVLEGIDRTSLQARNEGQTATVQSLTKQVDSLTQQLNGKNARLAEGAKAGADITARVVEKSNATLADLYFDYKNKSASGTWLNGPTVELFNTTLEDVTVNIKMKNANLVWINGPSIVTLKPQEKVDITLQIDYPKFNRINSKGENYGGSVVFSTPNGELSFTANMWRHKT